MIEWLLMGNSQSLMFLTQTLVLFYFPGLMEIRSVSVGVVAIKSVSTGLYLAMSKKGTLFGSVSIQPGNIVSGGQDGMAGKGRRVMEVHTNRGPKWVPIQTCLILLKWNLRNLLLERQEKVQSYYQSWLYTWALVDDTCSWSMLVPLSK